MEDTTDLTPGAAPRPQLPVAEKAGGCGCGCTDEGVPALDVRPIPHAIRHATVFGALESLRPGQQMDLVAHHDPKPLLAQIDDRWGDGFSRVYRESGPQAWVIRFTRV